MSLAEPLAVALELSAVLEKLEVPYLVGGSLASSVYGVPRSTEDLDLLVELPGRLVDSLVAELSPSFYVDRDMILDAIRRRASFNVVHLLTMFKVDLFVSDRSELLREEMQRRRRLDLGNPPRPLWVCSPEDIVVQKLDWYERGQRVSERQWRDLLGVLRVAGPGLDLDYIRRWSNALGLAQLCERALSEAGLGASR